MKMGIYKITNIINGKVYIGQTNDYKRRKRDHIRRLNNGSHHNEHLQRAWTHYGENSFVFEFIEECAEKDLDKREKYYIDKYKSVDANYGYNLVVGGQSFRKFTPELKQKLSKALKGRILTDAHKRHISEGNKGRVIAKESINKCNLTKTINGTIARGEKNGNALISDDTAKKIILDLYEGKAVSDLKKDYNISQDVIYNLMYNKSYKHILPEIREDIKSRTTVNNTQKANIAVEMYLAGKSQNEIAKEIRISRNTLRAILQKLNINTQNI